MLLSALEQAKESLLVLNGFKDRDFVKLAFAGAGAGKKVVIVIEKMSASSNIRSISQQKFTAENPTRRLPMVGVRVKLYSKGSGKWEKSGGEAAKFGLTTTEILEVIRQLQEAGRVDMLQLLHFHIGSQLTDIKRIKNAMKEAARTYAKIRQDGDSDPVSSTSAAVWRSITTDRGRRSNPRRITTPANSPTTSSM